MYARGSRVYSRRTTGWLLECSGDEWQRMQTVTHPHQRDHDAAPTPSEKERKAPSMAEFYVIRIKGRLNPAWVAWFEGLTLTYDADGTTILSGTVVDQAALHGILAKIRDLGIPLLAVSCVAPEQIRK
jgi:hypothetical protein